MKKPRRQGRLRREPRPNINENIRASTVEVVDHTGAMRGPMPLQEAIAIAKQNNLDLYLIAEKSPYPLCKILDYSKHKYLQSKRNREAKKQHKTIEIKVTKLRLNIGEHDYQTKIKNTAKFLEDGKKVKVELFFRGREITHKELGSELFNRISTDLENIGAPEKPPQLNGKNLSMVLAPVRKKC